MKPLYLEPDEEITTVIEKLAAISDRQVAVVVPKNSPLFQSLVNLKLLVKEANRLDKKVAIISSDKIGARLAATVGLAVYASLQPSTNAPLPDRAVSRLPESRETEIDGVKVHQYISPTGESPPTSTKEPDSAPMAAEQPISQPTEPKIMPEIEPASLQSVGPASVERKDPDYDRLDELPAIVKRDRVAWSRPSFKFNIPWRSIGVAGFLTVIALAAVYFFLPKATLTLTFKAEPLTNELILAVETVPSGSN
ncbi:MAG: hypothetical protein AAB499_02680, partial [Patescibacteria group bacterium]